MRKTFILYCFCFVCFGCIAQKGRPNNPIPIPITKEAALAFKNINEAIGLPISYEVVGGTISITMNGEVLGFDFRDLAQMKEWLVKKEVKTGDFWGFSGVILKKVIDR